MAWFTVQIGSHQRTINVSGSYIDAVTAVELEWSRPRYCRLHDELLSKGRIDGVVGQMGYYYPKPIKATAVRLMNQPTNALLVYPAGDWVAV